MAIICIAMISTLSCNKLEKSVMDPVNPTKIELNGPDMGCASEGHQLKAGLRSIVFEGDIPSTVEVTLNLGDDADVKIFARDCCIEDDIVQVWVNDCLIGTINSVNGEPGEYETGGHQGVTFTVSLVKGTYTIKYINTFSGTDGPSGWYVSELEEEFTGQFLPCDADNDGCKDNVDPYPNSILTPTIIIDGCNTGVPNLFAEPCTTMMDLIMTCADNAINHGDFVSCVSQLTNTWKSAKKITGAQKGLIMDCADHANIP